ncbi:hypothetical protein FLAT13_01730 [Flavobacterium salmonis]|uniref:Uncharacterized protein n=1 Tax=Flavobacterium salmonis TaxID=2654844 RepID=A0A6V6YVH2_9FLAO|nr:hypothetical protein FLAT13_01730 [Flavobacterium salmonis]
MESKALTVNGYDSAQTDTFLVSIIVEYSFSLKLEFQS